MPHPKLPIDQVRMNADLPAYTEMVYQSRQNEAFNIWLRGEIERGMRNTPLMQQQSQMGGVPAE